MGVNKSYYMRLLFLINIIANNNGIYRKAYVVLGGNGFSQNVVNFLLNQQYRQYFTNGNLVEVLDYNGFQAHVNVAMNNCTGL